MSRVGNMPIPIPAGVQVQVQGNNVTVKGKLGELKRTVPPQLKVTLADGKLTVARPDDLPASKSIHGLSRTLLANMVNGVSTGYRINLDLVGTGYRVEQKGKSVVMQLGFSHPVPIDPFKANILKAESQVRLSISGPDKETVGEQAARVRLLKKPNVYTGKGIKYENEVIRRKAGKTGPGATST